MNEATFGKISPREHARDAKKPTHAGLTRRDVLKGGVAALALTASKPVFDRVGSYIDAQKIEKALADTEDRVKKQIELEATQEQITIQKTDHDVIGKTFEEQILTQDSITIDSATKKAIYSAWREKYDPGGVEHSGSLLAGLERMQPWIHDIKEIFKKYDIPEEFIYLGITESHFLTDAISGKKAAGPYQATEKTAHKLMSKIHITNDFDERRDPVISAELCARHLRESYDRFGNWDLALMDYNGGFTNSYLLDRNVREEEVDITIQSEYKIQKNDTLSSIAKKFQTSVTLLKRANNLHSSKQIRELQLDSVLQIPQEREKLTMDGFNRWLEYHINLRIKNAMDGPDYVIQSGDTIGTIAQEFGTSTEILKSLNNIPPAENKIIAGQPLSLPGVQEKKKRHFIKTLLHHYHENINYPEKFYAIRDVVDEYNLDHIFDNAKKEYKDIKVPKVNLVQVEHTITKGDTLSKITNELFEQLKRTYPKFEKSKVFIKRALMQQNSKNIPSENEIKAGKKLILNMAIQKPATLKDIAHKHNVPPETLLSLNPAVKSINIHLPDRKSIRIPA